MKPLLVIAVVLSVVAVAAVWAAGGNTLETYESNEPIWTRPITIANFPDPQIVAGTVDVGNLPAVQEVTGTVVVANLQSGPPRFAFVGITNAKFDGSGNGGGWFAMTTACAADYPGSRMAFSDEVMSNTNPPNPPRLGMDQSSDCRSALQPYLR